MLYRNQISANQGFTSYPLSEAAPLAIDLYCGLGGWAEGFLSEGWRVIGFDIERHDYGTGGYPGQLVIQDVRTLHGSQLKDSAVIVASPPCQAYSYRAMPWKRAKALPPPDNTLFEECFRIQREACEAAGRYIPLIVENVRGAQKWVGRARANYGSFYLWGDIPALMPPAVAAIKVPSFRFDGSGQSFQSASVRRTNVGNGARFTSRDCGIEGVKIGGDWFSDPNSTCRRHGSKSNARKAASAQIAKIPFPLAQHIARVFKPVAASLLLIASLSGPLSPLTPVRKGTAAHMFVLAEIARKRYAQFRLDFETSVRGNESTTAVMFDFDGTSRDIPQSKGVVPTEISSPRRLRVKGTDTDSLMGGRIESGETGILASDGAQANHEARPGEPYTATGSPVITPAEPGALPPALDELAKKFRPLIDRVMARLSEAEQQEINTHYQADYRQSWICLSFANRGISEPFVSSSYQMYGIHPSKVWERIVADRKERLGAEYYDWYSSDDLLRPDVPKIPPTATADIHAANGADPPCQGSAPFPINKERAI